jgi:hypothetical protein
MKRTPPKPGRLLQRSLRLLVAGTAAGLALVAGVSLQSPQPASASSTSSVYWGSYIDGAPFTPSLMDTFESNAGKKMSIVHWGESFIRGSTYQTFQSFYMQQVRNRGSIPMLTWGSWDSSQGSNQPNFKLSNVINGTYDSYIIQWAQSARAWGQPFFLRFDHEMNGNWQFPWSEQLNGNQPGQYVAAWRHVHDIFTQQGATNATWVWCPNVAGSTTTAFSELYPGDKYVDWTCLDGYNWGKYNTDVWQTFGQVFSGATFGGYNKHDSYHELLALAPSKPIMLGEVASSEVGGSKATWMSDMFSTQLQTNFPQIKAVVWTNWNDDNPNLSWPVESSASSQAAFKAAIASNYYSTNEFGSISGGAIQPLGSASAPAPAPNTSGSVTLDPEADTYTSASASTSTAGGSSATLRADVTGSDTAFLRYDLSSLSGKTITSATLSLHTSTESWAGSGATFDARLVNATDWKEQYMSAANTVPVTSTVVGSLAAPKTASSSYTMNLNVTTLQSRAGSKLSLALSSRSGDVLIFYAREAGASKDAQLVINYK